MATSGGHHRRHGGAMSIDRHLKQTSVSARWGLLHFGKWATFYLQWFPKGPQTSTSLVTKTSRDAVFKHLKLAARAVRGSSHRRHRAGRPKLFLRQRAALDQAPVSQAFSRYSSRYKGRLLGRTALPLDIVCRNSPLKHHDELPAHSSGADNNSPRVFDQLVSTTLVPYDS